MHVEHFAVSACALAQNWWSYRVCVTEGTIKKNCREGRERMQGDE